MRVLVVLGHPRTSSLGGTLAREFAEGARRAGNDVRELRLAELSFAPDVTCSSPARQFQEPDLCRARRLVGWAEHLVFVYPTWWGTAPARMKAFLDRLLIPGWAFAHRSSGRFEPLLRGRTAELITTMDTPNWVYRWIYRSPGHRALAAATLGFCGIETVRVTSFGPVHNSTEARRKGWVHRARALGRRLENGARTPVQRTSRTAGNWLRALRLHFYPMSVLGYLLGSLAASRDAGLHHAPFWFGLVALVALKATTVLTNDLFDHESDRQNGNWGPFTGGSRSIVEKRLSRSAMAWGAGAAFAVAIVAGVGLLASAASPIGTMAVILVLLAVLAVGYTVPPLSLSHRGLGELDVAVTHGIGVIGLGWVAQGGGLLDGFPWILGLLVGLAILPAIILAGIPDRTADSAAGKRTLAVRLGSRGAAVAATILVGAAAAASVAAAVWLPLDPIGLSLPVLAVPHAVVLVGFLTPYLSAGAPERRIDGLIAGALLFIIWFVALPVIHLV